MRKIHSCTTAYLRANPSVPAADLSDAVVSAQRLAGIAAQLRQSLAEGADKLSETELEQVLLMLKTAIADIAFAADRLRSTPVEQDIIVAAQPTAGDEPDTCTPDTGDRQTPAAACEPARSEEPSPQRSPTATAQQAKPTDPEPQSSLTTQPRIVADAASLAKQARTLRRLITVPAVLDGAGHLNRLNTALIAAAEDVDAIFAMFADAPAATPGRPRGVRRRRRRTQDGGVPAAAVTVPESRPLAAAGSRPTPRLLAEGAHRLLAAPGRRAQSQPAGTSR
ncbi:hypothetical protein GCM10009661_75100 [Catellatospora chokoriensis]|uniref:Uncharacterized protein n=1 Tax=Catellatospora chokoriensis TaxID=310353 RepID=A0A8J3K6A6_9ACTN|nr:hypothetical protein Cch02nite_82880 [Catellatospora chokoriensis]